MSYCVCNCMFMDNTYKRYLGIGSKMPYDRIESNDNKESLSDSHTLSGQSLTAEVYDFARMTARVAKERPVEATLVGAGVIASAALVLATRGKTTKSILSVSESLPLRCRDVKLSLVPKDIAPLPIASESKPFGFFSAFKTKDDGLPRYISLDGLLPQRNERILRGQSRIFGFDSDFRPCLGIEDRPTILMQVGLSKNGSLELQSMTAGRPLHGQTTKMHLDGGNERRWNTSYKVPFGKSHSVTLRDAGKDDYMWTSVADHRFGTMLSPRAPARGQWALEFQHYQEGRNSIISTNMYPA